MKAAATHYFLLPKGVRLFEPLSPHRYFHLGELLHFDEDAPLVHTSKFPVIGRGAWVMDIDNFGYPFVCGRAMLNPAYREKLIDSEDLRRDAIRRVQNMLYACSHPSCRAVMFWTETERQSAEAQIAAYQLKEFGGEFLLSHVLSIQRNLPFRSKSLWRNGMRSRPAACHLQSCFAGVILR